MTIGTFTCSFCAGLCRHFQHRCYSINATSFTMKQYEFLKENGNKRLKKRLYLAKISDESYLY